MRNFRLTSSFRAWLYATRGIPHGRKIINRIKAPLCKGGWRRSRLGDCPERTNATITRQSLRHFLAKNDTRSYHKGGSYKVCLFEHKKFSKISRI